MDKIGQFMEVVGASANSPHIHARSNTVSLNSICLKKIVKNCAVSSLLALALLLMSSLAQSAASETTDTKAQFRLAYAGYQTSLASGSPGEALIYAKNALVLGSKLLDKESATYAQLQLNVGSLQVATGDIEAEKMLQRTLWSFQKIYGDEAPELIEPLVAYGHARNMRRYSTFRNSEYDRAIKIARRHFGDTDDLVVKLNLDIGNYLMDQGLRESGSYIRNALKISTKVHGLDSELSIAPLFARAKYKMAHGNYKDAERLFKSVLDIFAEHHPNKPQIYESTSRAFLVQALEAQGKSAEANKYCREIGAERIWKVDIQPTPLYEAPIRFPKVGPHKRVRGYC